MQQQSADKIANTYLVGEDSANEKRMPKQDFQGDGNPSAMNAHNLTALMECSYICILESHMGRSSW